jgi:hypothetical protein
VALGRRVLARLIVLPLAAAAAAPGFQARASGASLEPVFDWSGSDLPGSPDAERSGALVAVAWVGRVERDPPHVFAAISRDGGRTFDRPAPVAEAAALGSTALEPIVLIDAGSRAGPGVTGVITIAGPGPGARLRSRDGGRSWERAVSDEDPRASAADRRWVVSRAAGPRGEDGVRALPTRELRERRPMFLARPAEAAGDALPAIGFDQGQVLAAAWRLPERGLLLRRYAVSWSSPPPLRTAAFDAPVHLETLPDVAGVQLLAAPGGLVVTIAEQAAGAARVRGVRVAFAPPQHTHH